jgi:DNA-binding Xre family transcriptional regulator
MNEGELVKLYVQRENVNEADLANAVGVSEGDLHKLYQSQTVEPDIKNKLKSFLNRDIFDGSILTDYYTNVPDEQANKMKS